jgi:hypothetical protein
VVRWIESDGLLRTKGELVAEATQELGYQRRAARIVDALTRAARVARDGTR